MTGSFSPSTNPISPDSDDHEDLTVLEVTMESSQNTRILEQVSFCAQQTIHTTRGQDLNPRLFSDNADPSVLAHEMMTIEPGENPSHVLTWKPTDFLSHIIRRTHDDKFPMTLWETWFCSSFVVPHPSLVGTSSDSCILLPLK